MNPATPAITHLNISIGTIERSCHVKGDRLDFAVEINQGNSSGPLTEVCKWKIWQCKLEVYFSMPVKLP
jgi:hypothetical protein